MHKISANRTEKQIYLHFPEVQPNFCVRAAYTKDSANRTEKQIYLHFPEVQPNLPLAPSGGDLKVLGLRSKH